MLEMSLSNYYSTVVHLDYSGNIKKYTNEFGIHIILSSEIRFYSMK
jgi:hypothetical protein